MRQEWASFNGGVWQKEINVRDFIQKNYTPYEGDESFLAGPTKATNDLWAQVMELTEEEHKKGGVLDMDTHIISTITSHGPGYLNKEKETIVGFQTDKPFKRALQPNGGIRMAIKALQLSVSIYIKMDKKSMIFLCKIWKLKIVLQNIQDMP